MNIPFNSISVTLIQIYKRDISILDDTAVLPNGVFEYIFKRKNINT